MGVHNLRFSRHPAIAWGRLLPESIVLFVARCGPLGRLWPSPGTYGSLTGLVVFSLLVYPWGLVGQLITLSFLTYLGIVICQEAERRLQKIDPGEVIFDEVVGMGWTLVGFSVHGRETTMLLPLLVAGFVLFRFFDILKPLGIYRLQRLPGGAGVVADDVVAGLVSAACLHAIDAWLYPALH